MLVGRRGINPNFQQSFQLCCHSRQDGDDGSKSGGRILETEMASIRADLAEVEALLLGDHHQKMPSSLSRTVSIHSNHEGEEEKKEDVEVDI